MREREREGEMEGSIEPSSSVVFLPSSIMDPFEDRTFLMFRKMLWFVGIWYGQPYRERVLRSFIIGSLYLCIIVAQLCQLCTLDDNLQKTITTIQIFVPVLSIGSLYFTAILRYGIIQTVYHYIIEDYSLLKDDVEVNIVRVYANRSKIFLQVLTLMFVVFVGFFIFLIVIRKMQSTSEDNINDYIFPISTCMDRLIDPEIYYYFVATYQVVIIVIISTTALSGFSLYVFLTQYICARFSIIISRIREQFENNLCMNDVSKKPKDFSHWLIDIMQYFTRTVEYVNLVNSLAQECYLLQIFLGLCFLVIHIFKLFQVSGSLEAERSEPASLLILYILVSIFALYFNCHIGQRLMDCNVEVYREACLIPIYEISLGTQKLLLTTLILIAKPCSISIGKIFVSSHEFFSNLLRTSLSFAMVLHSLQTV